jgi:hypothetical protein
MLQHAEASITHRRPYPFQDELNTCFATVVIHLEHEAESWFMR